MGPLNSWIYPKIVIFHSYVSLPEGKPSRNHANLFMTRPAREFLGLALRWHARPEAMLGSGTPEGLGDVAKKAAKMWISPTTMGI